MKEALTETFLDMDEILKTKEGYTELMKIKSSITNIQYDGENFTIG
jgi:hypothetical protein